MSQRKEKYLRHALNEANRLEGAAMEVAAMGERLERHMIGTDRRLAASIRDTQQLRDEVRRQRRRRDRAAGRGMAYLAMILAVVSLILSVAAITRPGTEAEQPAPADSRAAELATMTVMWMDGLLVEQEEDPMEDEKITDALLAQGYLSDLVPLSYEDQDFLRTASKEGGVPYAMALAVIETETNFNNVAGDDGDSVGYMQVAQRWHSDRMGRLGVTDLWDPYGNFRVGCDFLGELLEDYGDPDKALMAYNMGPKRAAELWEEGIYETQYSRTVMERAGAWEKAISDAGGTPGC